MQVTLAAQVGTLVSQTDVLKAELTALQATPRQVSAPAVLLCAQGE